MLIATENIQRRITLRGISWDLYQDLLHTVGDNHLRLTFDQGNLEIMSPSSIHEKAKTALARMIEVYADERDIDLEGLGSTTFDRVDLQKGLEPDECYYIANASAVIGKDDLDFQIDPPPDLAIEVDISRPEVSRQPIYAALGVAEIWKFDGRQVVSLHRVVPADGGVARYVASETSLSFPEWPMAEVNRLLQLALARGQKAAIKALREWCREA